METCRTCAKCDFGDDDEKWLDLFHPIRCQSQMENIRIELDIWKLQITPNDGLPQKMCTDCCTKFGTINKFRLECQDAQLLLKNLFENIDSHSDMSSELENGKILKSHDSELCSQDVIIFPKQTAEDDLHYCINDALDEHTEEKQIHEMENSQNDQMEEDKSYDLDEATNDATNDDETQHTELNELPNFNHAEDLEVSKKMYHYDKSDFITIDTADNFSKTNQEQPPSEDTIYITLKNDTDSEKVAIVTMLPPNNNNSSDQSGDCAEEIDFAFECKYCYKLKDEPGEQFQTQDELLEHIAEIHDSINPYDCPHCDERYPDAQSRTVHMKNQHVRKKFTCDVCDKKYADRFNLRHHIEKYHNKADYQCTACDKKFPSRKSLKYHSRWHIPERQLKCAYCDRLFISERQMKIHEVTHSGVRNSEYCTFCGKSFFHIKTLRWHIYRNHGGEKPFKCTLCTDVFESYKEKRIHMLEKHAKNLTTKEKSQCMICHKKCSNEINLIEHMNNDHEENTIPIVNDKRVLQTKKEKQFSGVFQCDECPQRFNLKSALVRHSAVHNVEGRPHVCTECKKRFKRVQDLRWHMKTHSNEKPNVCDVCGKGFALKYVLTQHKKSHEALEKCFQCATCGRTYLFEKSLRLHERIHTGKTYYNCDLCEEKFVTHIKFLCHMRKFHAHHNSKNQSLEDDTDEVISE